MSCLRNFGIHGGRSYSNVMFISNTFGIRICQGSAEAISSPRQWRILADISLSGVPIILRSGFEG